jgi:hypothetical protein
LPTGTLALSPLSGQELSLFGSVARGEMRPDSDVDLLSDFLPGAPWAVGRFGDDARTHFPCSAPIDRLSSLR